MDVNIFIEGQAGLNWPRWQRIVDAAERLGFAGLYRSDHLVTPAGPVEDALETWMSLAWVASTTHRIHFGTLVSPTTFRDPRILAWQANALSSLSCGRLHIGLGAGWQEREHAMFGYDLPPLDERFARLEEALVVLKMLASADRPSSFAGEYFQLENALLHPRSPRAGGPPIIIGGNGPKRTLPLVAKYADEWNAMGLTPEQFRQRNELLDQLLVAEGRDPSSVRRSHMTRAVIARDEEHLLARTTEDDRARIQTRGAIVGTPEQIQEIFVRQADAGVQAVMLQWLDLDDITGLELFAATVLPFAATL